MARPPKPGKWQHVVENLTAFERADRGLAIYTRVRDGRRYKDRQRLCDTIRTADGKIDHAREAEAIRLAVERQRRAASGIVDVSAADLTLELGFRRVLHDRDGKYAATTAWKRDVDRYRTVIENALGPELRWSDLKAAHYRKLWRALAHEHVRDPKKYGPRAAEVIVGSLQSAARWLLAEELVDSAGMPAPNWRQTMKNEWADITGRAVAGPAKPRYSRPEQARMWAALPGADPRLVIAVEIGAELRLGQVTRSKRSDVKPHGGFRVGAVVVHGRGKKHGELVVLTMEQRHALTRALTRGYLADLEAAHRRVELKDYYLIPGGWLKAGKDGIRRAQVKNAMRRWERTPMRKAWRRLERAAGVKHVRGRNWYGLRRLHADMAEDVEKDARVLNTLGAWTDTATREGYQEQGRVDLKERAAKVRRQIRPRSKR